MPISLKAAFLGKTIAFSGTAAYNEIILKYIRGVV